MVRTIINRERQIMQAEIALLPGDGIGPEVLDAAVQVLDAVATAFGHGFSYEEFLVGGCAIDACGTALPEETLLGCQRADALLLGAVGGPKWDNPRADVRPEQGLLGLRKAMDLFANLRPIRPDPHLLHASPIRPERLAGVDLIVVRELTGDVYYGQPRFSRIENGEMRAVDTMSYTESEIRQVAHVAFHLARERQKKVSSVDKANVLECSRLWRRMVEEVSLEYPDVVLEHLLVDATAMYLITRPANFDVILTANLFGDILTDEASVLTGSMGNMPSASLGKNNNQFDLPRGLYEPIHGSAPDIAGKGVANPIGAILSAAMMLRHSFDLDCEALVLERAVQQAIADGCRTADLGGSLTTAQIVDEIIDRLPCGMFIGI
jgi:3-isopropylmalate dehydrogenase